jgi:hypothetical protein
MSILDTGRVARHKVKAGLFLVAGVSSALALPAAAQSTDVTSLLSIQQQQIQQLQQQLQILQEQVKTEQAQRATPVAEPAPASNITVGKDSSITLGNGVKLTPGGFIEAATIYRDRNETADVDSNFNGSPLQNNANYNHGEFRESARQSRLSLLAEGNFDKDTKLSAYFEGDFLGVGEASNSNQSNSYVPRIRNLYMTSDWNDLGLHLLAGQSWSLLTPNTVGITPRTEAPPPTIDAQYVVGYDWTRSPGIRLVKDWDQKYWLGISLETPATLDGTSGALSPDNTNAGGTLLNSAVNYTTDIAPDIIVKGAVDTGFGHYELFSLTRFFQNRPTATALAAIPGADRQNATTVGWGVGGNAIIPVVPKYLDFQANIMGGQGIGRYGTSNLPDVTVGSNGELVPLTEVTAMAGFTGHVTPTLDTYVFAGTERVDSAFSNFDGNEIGYGNPLYSNAGCFTEGATATCTANTKNIDELSVGTWWSFYKGSFGKMMFGLQGAYFRRETFEGIGGAPSPNETEVFTSFRYYPF